MPAVVILILGILALGQAVHARSGASGAPAFVEGQILVQPRAGLPDSALNALLQAHGAQTASRIPAIGVRVVRVPRRAEEQVAAALSRRPEIRFAEVDRLVSPDERIPDDPRYGDAWHLPAVDASAAWSVALGGDVIVAILDTGVDASHPDLADKLLYGYNSADGSTTTSDVHGHGTRVAGAAAASTNNATGVAAIGWDARILPVRITNRSDGVASFSAMAEGVIWAADNGATVANISYDATRSSTVASAAQYMRNRGGVVVVAAGNSGGDPGYADSPYMTSVSAFTSSGNKASWSSYGDYINVAAPGAGILTTSSGGGYASASGTSFASPVTAGVFALMRSANSSLSAAELDDVLYSTANNPNGDWDPYFGHGKVDAAAAVAEAARRSYMDSTPPEVRITSPSDGARVSGTVAVDVSASDDGSGIKRVDLYAGGSLVGSTEVSPYEFSWDSTSVSDGDVDLRAEAVDNAGNRASARITVSVENSSGDDSGGGDDGTPLTVRVTSPSDGEVVSGTVRLSASASSGHTITMLRLRVDGTLACAGDGDSLRCNWNSRHHPGGQAVISAEAEDAGGRSDVSSVTVTVESGGGGGGGNNNNNRGGGNNR